MRIRSVARCLWWDWLGGVSPRLRRTAPVVLALHRVRVMPPVSSFWGTALLPLLVCVV